MPCLERAATNCCEENLGADQSDVGMGHMISLYFYLLTTEPFMSVSFQQSIPSPTTLFDEERSRIFIVLLPYSIKSSLCGDMQTEAPESTTKQDVNALPEKQCTSLQVETQQEGNSDNSLIIVLAANREYLSNFHDLTGIVQ